MSRGRGMPCDDPLNLGWEGALSHSSDHELTAVGLAAPGLKTFVTNRHGL